VYRVRWEPLKKTAMGAADTPQEAFRQMDLYIEDRLVFDARAAGLSGSAWSAAVYDTHDSPDERWEEVRRPES
jgi:hypothetical protein